MDMSGYVPWRSTRHPRAAHAPSCTGCDDIGGCYACGAVPWCLVINDDGYCKSCGVDQGDESTASMEELVRRDLRAIKGIRPVE